MALVVLTHQYNLGKVAYYGEVDSLRQYDIMGPGDAWAQADELHEAVKYAREQHAATGDDSIRILDGFAQPNRWVEWKLRVV